MSTDKKSRGEELLDLIEISKKCRKQMEQKAENVTQLHKYLAFELSVHRVVQAEKRMRINPLIAVIGVLGGSFFIIKELF